MELTVAGRGIPAICAELRIRAEGNVIWVNVHDMAPHFEKRPDHVMRDIELLKQSGHLPKFGEISWFREATVLDAYGREQPSCDMTRDGFILLVMGWSGPKALPVKVRYIEAFNAMEQAISVQHAGMLQIDTIFAGMMEAHKEAMHVIETTHVNHIALRSDVDVIRTDVAEIKEDVSWLKHVTKPHPRSITKLTKEIHIAAITVMGGHCPCCGQSRVVDDKGNQLPFSEFDHFYQNSMPNAEHSWLICRPCHADLSTGRVPRHQREAEFRAYQQKRLRLPGVQPSLFGGQP